MSGSQRFKARFAQLFLSRFPAPRICLLSSVLCLLISGCASVPRPAPVIERAPPAQKAAKSKPSSREAAEKDWRPQVYKVQKGDTLYTVALEHGLDYKELAEWNGIAPPYHIKVGQELKLTTPQAAVRTSPLKATPGVEPAPLKAAEAMLKTYPRAVKLPYSEQNLTELERQDTADSVKPEKTAEKVEDKAAEKKSAPAETEEDDRVEWGWPANGKMISGFNGSANAKGIDIAGAMGQPVTASAAGKVVYSGSGLRGYGKLIIIKHNKTYLSAYAHNSKILVREGQQVLKGQKIAEMGSSDAERVKLHFEIRRLGKPVDPVKYLTVAADG